MKKALLTFAALAVALGAVAGSRMATEEWVRSYVAANAPMNEAWVSDFVSNYVERTVGTAVGTRVATNGTYYTSNGVTLFIENSTEQAVVVAQQTALSASFGYTNRCVFAKVPDAPCYRSGSLVIHEDEATTNFWTVAGGVTYSSRDEATGRWLVGPGGTNRFCRLAGAYIQPSQAAAILAIGGAE